LGNRRLFVEMEEKDYKVRATDPRKNWYCRDDNEIRWGRM